MTISIQRTLNYLLLTLCFSLGNISSSNAETLSPNEILRINFSFIGAGSYTEDVLSYTWPSFNTHPAVSIVTEPSSSTTHTLYDEDVLLGSYEQTSFVGSQLAAFWVSPTSTYKYLSPEIVNLSSIEDGTVNGRVDIRLSSGLLDFDLDQYTHPLSFMQGTGRASGVGSTSSVLLTKASIISASGSSVVSDVPEPSVLWLSSFSIMSILFGKRRKKTTK